MQFLSVESVSSLKDLCNLVGDRNADYILVANGLKRVPNIKTEYDNMTSAAITLGIDANVDAQKKKTILNKFTQDSDVFETAALLSETNWRVLSQTNTIPGYLYIPETITLASSANVLGNGEAVRTTVYKDVMDMLSVPPYIIDPIVFNEYSTIKNTQITTTMNNSTGLSTYWFPIPLGEVTLYSSLASTSIDFPTYPEELEDKVQANYTQMPDLLYQYEPWYVYESSGPRSLPFSFDIHRDMWSGDHNDGKANELIRFCQACNYPEYNGSAVYSDIVTLYIHGSSYISGIMTDCSVKWDGPILDDGWYAHFVIDFTITEISQIALNNSSVRSKPLIG